VGFLLLGTAPTYAITINNVNDAGYITGNSSYTGVVKINFNSTASAGTFICSGSLVSSMHILTAGHCVDDAYNWQVTFETASGSSTLGVSASAIHPLFAPRVGAPQLPQYDVAVLTLAALAPSDAEIYGLKTDLAGITSSSLIDIVGYGLGGNPFVGHLNTGTRRHAVNTIDGFFGPVSTFPDAVFAMSENFSTTGPSNFGLINGGDSGGAAFFGNQIIGVASFGNLPRPPDAFADLTYQTGHESLADAEIAAWIHTAIVPEPGTLILVSIGLGVVARRRSRKG
jgi:hypothetical protein